MIEPTKFQRIAIAAITRLCRVAAYETAYGKCADPKLKTLLNKIYKRWLAR
jgi:hypothetical protein